MARDSIRCSFCGKRQEQVGRIIAGPNVYICNECVELCSSILRDEMHNGVNTQQLELPFRASLFNLSANTLQRDGILTLFSHKGPVPSTANFFRISDLDKIYARGRKTDVFLVRTNKTAGGCASGGCH